MLTHKKASVIILKSTAFSIIFDFFFQEKMALANIKHRV